MSSDPFDLLRTQLVDAAARAHGPRRARLGARRVLPALVATLAVGGAAAAAALTLQGEPSRPLAGRLSAASPSTYRISLSPDLRAGQAGWCSTVALRRNGRAFSAGTGCGGAAPGGSVQIVGGGMVVPGHSLVYAITAPRVAAVRLDDGRVVRTVASPQLPFGWRAAVATGPRIRRAPELQALGRLTFLDAGGRALPEPPTRDQTPAPLVTRPVDPEHPVAARCVIAHRDLGALRPLSQRVVTGPVTSAGDLAGRPLRSCAEAQFQADRGRLTAAVLVDAVHPWRSPAALPPGAPLAARRAGNAWLVVAGGSGAAQRRWLLARLRRAG